MRTAPTRWLLFLSSLSACNNIVNVPSDPGSVPVVEAVLIAGTTTSSARLAWTDPTGVDPLGRPVNSAEARLQLTDLDTGANAAFLPDAAKLGVFTASLPITAGHRFRLAGNVADRSIEASTTVPTDFRIEQPDSDPIDARQLVTFRWSSRGATLFGADRVLFGRSSSAYTTATSGTFRIREEGLRPYVDLLALSPEAERYLLDGAIPESNIRGGTGMLAGAIVVRRALAW